MSPFNASRAARYQRIAAFFFRHWETYGSATFQVEARFYYAKARSMMRVE
jgi:hypothetical protein